MHIAFTIPWWVLIVIGGSILWWLVMWVLTNKSPLNDLVIHLTRPKLPNGRPGSTIYRREIALRCFLLGPVGWIVFIAWRGNP